MATTRTLADVIEKGIIDAEQARIGGRPLTQRSQSGVIAGHVERFLRERFADIAMEQLFPSPPEEF